MQQEAEQNAAVEHPRQAAQPSANLESRREREVQTREAAATDGKGAGRKLLSVTSLSSLLLVVVHLFTLQCLFLSVPIHEPVLYIDHAESEHSQCSVR